MKSVCLVLLGVLLAAPAAGQTTAAADVVSEVRAAISARDLDRADAFVRYLFRRAPRPDTEDKRSHSH